MRAITYLENKDQLDLIKNTPNEKRVDEVIIGMRLCSRFSENTKDEAIELAHEARELGLKVFFEWDVLATQSSFEQITQELTDFPWASFDAVRVQDPGAMEWMRQNRPETKLHLILERGNHNLIGIKRWVALYQEQVSRVVLSLELSREKLVEILKQLDVEVEFMVLGRILLFYTPRNLLSVPYFDHDEGESKPYYQKPTEVLGHSEESPHSGFPLLENSHGTFMFNTKDHCLLENLKELQQMGMSSVRFDLRFAAPWNLLPELVFLAKDQGEDFVSAANDLRERWPTKVIRGYYNVNRSDRLFSKLKNSRSQRRDESFAAEVVDSIKDSHLGFIVKNKNRAVKAGELLKILTPDGKNKEITLNRIWSATGEELQSVSHGQLFFAKWHSGVSLKSMAYFDDPKANG